MPSLNFWKTVQVVLLFGATSQVAHAQSFRTILSFNGPNGNTPYRITLIQATDGGLYGTTLFGGDDEVGTVFRISPKGLKTVYSFSNQPGSGPTAGVIQSIDAQFYGSTEGGASNEGTIFKVTARGLLTNLYSFCTSGKCADGMFPEGALVQALDGNFYGTTQYGGDLNCEPPNGCGTIFRITPDGVLTTLHIFEEMDGFHPLGALIQATDGNLYGTATQGGVYGAGTVFRLTPHGTFTVLYSFNDDDGYIPIGLMQASDGNIYGVTGAGGRHLNYGTIFKLTLSGDLTTLHLFTGRDGIEPESPLVQATDGNFYGTTAGGLSNTYGTIFRMTPDGTITTLHEFTGLDGKTPAGGLVQDTNGVFYGTATYGGDWNYGTLFSLDVGLGPFVSLVRNAGKIGSADGILGQGLTGTMSVSFNGTPATFTVVSGTLLKTTVPVGATSGYVTVTTPGGTLTSNKPFRVLP